MMLARRAGRAPGSRCHRGAPSRAAPRAPTARETRSHALRPLRGGRIGSRPLYRRSPTAATTTTTTGHARCARTGEAREKAAVWRETLVARTPPAPTSARNAAHRPAGCGFARPTHTGPAGDADRDGPGRSVRPWAAMGAAHDAAAASASRTRARSPTHDNGAVVSPTVRTGADDRDGGGPAAKRPRTAAAGAAPSPRSRSVGGRVAIDATADAAPADDGSRDAHDRQQHCASSGMTTLGLAGQYLALTICLRKLHECHSHRGRTVHLLPVVLQIQGARRLYVARPEPSSSGGLARVPSIVRSASSSLCHAISMALEHDRVRRSAGECICFGTSLLHSTVQAAIT